MESQIATTPFGTSPLSLSHVAARRQARERPAGTSVGKWQVFQWISMARPRLGLPERAITLLNALLSFHMPARLEGSRLVVFPSNVQLSLRAHGMAASTMRRHLAHLVNAGLLLRHDSPNGKRYARKGPGGAVDLAFGFDLAPLLARAAEFERMAIEIKDERETLCRLRERVSLHRRDIAKMISTGLDAGISLAGTGLANDWPDLHLAFRARLASASSRPGLDALEALARDLSHLAAQLLNLLEVHSNSVELSTNDAHFERHIQNSKPDSFVSEIRKEDKGRKLAKSDPDPSPRLVHTCPLELVTQACPDLQDYAPNGWIASWRDLADAAANVRPMLGISASAYEDAKSVMGPDQAAALIGAILQRGEAIQSPGGYLRSLTARARLKQFSLSPVLMALVRQERRASEAGTL